MKLQSFISIGIVAFALGVGAPVLAAQAPIAAPGGVGQSQAGSGGSVPSNRPTSGTTDQGGQRNNAPISGSSGRPPSGSVDVPVQTGSPDRDRSGSDNQNKGATTTTTTSGTGTTSATGAPAGKDPAGPFAVTARTTLPATASHLPVLMLLACLSFVFAAALRFRRARG